MNKAPCSRALAPSPHGSLVRQYDVAFSHPARIPLQHLLTHNATISSTHSAPTRHDTTTCRFGGRCSMASKVSSPRASSSATSTGGNAPIPKPSRNNRVIADTEFTQLSRGAAVTPLACISASTSWCGWEFFG